MLFVLLLVVHVVASTDLPICKEGEYRYDFTECDSAGGRWRVAVPRKPTECRVSGLESVRQKDCSSTCDPGQYLDVNSADQTCKGCPVGHYSLGGQVTFTNWTTFPDGFETRAFDKSHSIYSNKKGNCTGSAWRAYGIYLTSGFDTCTSQLTYAVTLKKDGSVTFTYQHTSEDLFFSVYVRNEQCMMSNGEHSYSYPEMSRNFELRNTTINLKRGHNLIVWETTLYPGNEETDHRQKPVLIKSIDVTGVAYTSECTPCPPGTYSNTVGVKRCMLCPGDYYSGEKATECTKCDTNTEYSQRGSAACTKKKACTVNDYIEIHSTCDKDNKFKRMFQWIEPKICRDDISGSTSLPVSGQMEDCPPCNPGMFINGTHCDYCSPMTFSDGKKNACDPCPASTEPMYGFDFHWWRSWPSNVLRFCHSDYNRGCASNDGFQLHGNYIDSGSGHADDARTLIFVEFEGFKQSVLNPGLGSVSFEFEMECEGPCSLSLHQALKEKGKQQYDLLKQWKGTQPKQKFVHQSSIENINGFYWVFEKDPNAKKNKYINDDDDDDMDHFNHREDKVKIYQIKITKTIDGGAATCKNCPVGMKDEGCIPCPTGHRIIPGKDKKPSCQPCPKNTYLNVTNPYGQKACIPCGPGLHSAEASTECVSSCHYSHEGKSYNFSPFSGFHVVKTSALFTPKGTKYYHQFNISFCPSDHGVQASCMSNVTESYDTYDAYNASVCRLTIIPSSSKDKPLAAQPLSVADQLMAIKTQIVQQKDEILGEENIENSTAVSFHYKANEITEACPQGRSTVIYLVCDPYHKEVKTSVPVKCSEGTCDGCSFHFIMRSSLACRLCTANDYDSVVTGCMKGEKNTTFMWRSPKICEGGAVLPERNSTACSILERSVKDFVVILRGFAIHLVKQKFHLRGFISRQSHRDDLGFAIFAGFVVLMVLAVFVLWYKNRRLEYKYHKLIQNSSDRSGEMPGAPQCVGDEEDEDDEEVHFKGKGRNGKGKGFFKNLKNKFSGDKTNLSEQYNFNNFSDDETIGSIKPTSKTPLS